MVKESIRTEGMFAHVGRVLVELREELGLTQKALAGRAGVSSATLSGYELGKHEPRLHTLGRVLDALGVDPEEFGRRLQSARGPRGAPRPTESGWLPEGTAVAVSEVLEDLASLTRWAIRRPAAPRRKVGEANGAEEESRAGDQ